MYKTIKQSPSEKRGERGSKHSLLRLLVAIGIIAFATSMTAVSCGKTADPNTNNNNANNSGGDGGGGDGGGGNVPEKICTKEPCLALSLVPGITTTKISGNTVTINAAGMATDANPLSATADTDRGFADASGRQTISAFNIGHTGATGAALVFVNRAHVTKDTITMRAVTAEGTDCSSSETDDNTLATAAGGGSCREYTATTGTRIRVRSYLGTVFNNTKTTSHARGALRCTSIYTRQVSGFTQVITDATILSGGRTTTCDIVAINNGGGAAAAEINDAWLTDTASVKEVRLYAIGINVTGKTIAQFSGAAGYGITPFAGAHDNAAFNRLLQNNPWTDLWFKVRIVNAAAFAALP